MDKLKELYHKVSDDIVLKDKFKKIIEQSDKKNPDELKRKLLAFAEDAGYSVTLEEIENFFEALSEGKDGQLSEADLDSVAGGKNSGNIKSSIATLGGYCAALSINKEISDGDCGGQF